MSKTPQSSANRHINRDEKLKLTALAEALDYDIDQVLKTAKAKKIVDDVKSNSN